MLMMLAVGLDLLSCVVNDRTHAASFSGATHVRWTRFPPGTLVRPIRTEEGRGCLQKGCTSREADTFACNLEIVRSILQKSCLRDSWIARASVAEPDRKGAHMFRTCASFDHRTSQIHSSSWHHVSTFSSSTQAVLHPSKTHSPPHFIERE